MDHASIERATHPSCRDFSHLETAMGYDPEFLGIPVPVPALTRNSRKTAYVLGDTHVIPYTRFSLCLDRERGLARWVAWNMERSTDDTIERCPGFRGDPRLPDDCQTLEPIYADPIDHGHLARRDDLTWGDHEEALRANADSNLLPNIAPQMNAFNQSRLKGVWGRLENAVSTHAGPNGVRLNIFGGAVLEADDPIHQGVAIPKRFWKVIIWNQDGRLKSVAFVLTQDLSGLPGARASFEELPSIYREFRLAQKRLATLARLCKLRFDISLQQETTAIRSMERRFPARMRSVDDIVWP